jgi:hypothetical protein
MDIPHYLKKMSNLNIAKIQSTSIPAQSEYHPFIINAFTDMFAKHPSKLRQDEVEKFKRHSNKKKSDRRNP